MAVPFNFIRYEIEKINYLLQKREDSHIEEDKLEHSLSIQSSLDHPTLYKLVIMVKTNGVKTIDLVVAGFFEWLIEDPEVDPEALIMQNGVFILLPFLRSILANISILDGGEPIIIPTINPFDMSNDSEKDLSTE